MQYGDFVYLLLFLPVSMAVYQIAPKRFRPFVLLLFSYVFFFSISKLLIVYLFVSTVAIYLVGLWINSIKEKEKSALSNVGKEEKKLIKKSFARKKNLVLFLGIAIQLVMLAATKYLTFFGNVLNDVFNLSVGLKKLAAPIGISFYTLQAISYMVDVANNKIEADKNIFRVALYMSFFPQIMEGPIARYDQTAKDLFKGEPIGYKSACFGYQRVILGFTKKKVIADRLNSSVVLLFNNYANYDGGMLLLAVIMYTLQLYMDFSGIMDIVIGTGEIFNVTLPENFKQPFFARNISDFWARWHISLGAWFKDYIFYPISLSKFSRKITGSLRKKIGNHFGPLVAGSIALMAVWFCNGLWHGAGYNYLFFGLYHFTFILLGNIFAPLFNKFYEVSKIDRENKVLRVFQSIRTTIIVLFGELFFEASSVGAGFYILKQIFTNFSFDFITKGLALSLKMDIQDYIIIIITTIIVFVISYLKEKGVNIREKVASMPISYRWTLYYILIMYVMIFGAYGVPYEGVDPMYADF